MMDASEFHQHLQEKARHVADSLNTLTPYERALVLHEAQAIWDERRAGTPSEQVATDATEDALTMITEWIGHLIRRLEPEAVVGLVEMFKEIDEEGRLQRLLEDVPNTD